MLALFLIVTLLWPVAFIFCLFFVFKPKQSWPLFANRERAAGMLAASVVVPFFLIVGLGVGAVGDVEKMAANAPPPVSKKPEDIAEEARIAASEAALAKEAQDARLLEQQTKEAKKHPARAIELVSTSASKVGFDVGVSLSGRIRNNGPIDVKDAVIMCGLKAESGTTVGFVTSTLYKVIPAGETIRFSDLNMGLADPVWATYGCEIMNATVIE